MKLAKIFSKGVVLQRNKPINVFGTGRGRVVVTLGNHSVSGEFNGEEWIVSLPAQKEGGPYKLVVCMNGNIEVIEDVWIGEVWLASGQSNMSYKFWEIFKLNGGKLPPDMKDVPNLKYFEVNVVGKLEYDEKTSNWYDCTVENIAHWFSAIPYYFALNLAEHTDMHIGIINASRGATRIEWWIPREKLLGTKYDLPSEIKHSDDVFYHCPRGSLFESYIKPVLPFTIDGIIWYQGESNRGNRETEYYGDTFEFMTECWRDAFADKYLPFLTVQLTKFGEASSEDWMSNIINADDSSSANCWARIREQQLIASKKVDNVYLITSLDTGEKWQIHPFDKQTIGNRLALCARNIAFGENNEYTGPIVEKMRVEGNKVIITFSHAEGLSVNENVDFICVCGEEKVYYNANYEIVNNELVVYSDNVSNPIAVKYAFCNWTTGGLINSSGFPASPFRMCIDI